jgi:hypothetical protein
MDQQEKEKREEKRERFTSAYKEIMEVIDNCPFSLDHKRDLKKRMLELSKYFSYFLWEGCFVGSPIPPPPHAHQNK